MDFKLGWSRKPDGLRDEVSSLKDEIRRLESALRVKEVSVKHWKARATAAESAMRFKFAQAMREVCEAHDRKFKTTTSWYWPV